MGMTAAVKSVAKPGKSAGKVAARVARPSPGARAEEAAATAVVEELLRTPSRALDAAARSVMERSFGHDFSGVRAHCDERSADTATALRADAFTIGQDIFFGPGAYQPHTREGRRLIAHELTHTLQQRQPGAPFTRTPTRALYRLDSAQAPAEAEAKLQESAADRGADRAFKPGRAAQGTVARRSIGSLLRGALTEVLDPARLTDIFAQNLVRKLQADPDDQSGKIRLQMNGLAPLARASVLDRVEATLTGAAWERLVRVLEQPVPAGEEGAESADARESPPKDDEQEPAEPRPQGERAKEKAGEEAGGDAAKKAEDGKAREKGPPAGPQAKTTEAPKELAPKVPELELEIGPATHPEAGPVTAAAGPQPAKSGGGPPGAAGEGGAVAVGAGGPDPEMLVEEMAPPIARKDTERSLDDAAAAPEEAAPQAADETEREPRTQTSTGFDAATTEAAPSPVADEPTTPPAGSPEPGADADAGAVEEAPAPATEPTADVAPPEPAPPEFAAPEAAAPEAAAPEPPAAAMTPEPAAPSMSAAPGAAAGPTAVLGESENPVPAVAETSSTVAGDDVATGGETSAAAGPGADAAAPGPGGEGAAGNCSAQPEPPARPEPEAGGACGGGGSGGGAPEKPAAQPPEVSKRDPAAAMAAVAALSPGQAKAALGGVAAAAKNSVSDQRAELQANPPQLQDPTGVPQGRAGGAAAAPASKPGAAAAKVDRAPAGAPSAAIKPIAPAPLPEAPKVAPPPISSDAQQKLSQDDIQNVRAAADQLQTTDPALADASAGAAPELVLEGDADPGQGRAQRSALDKAVATAQTAGRDDAGRPMGEDHVYPKARTETLRAEIPASEASPCGKEGGEGEAGAAGGDAADGEAVSAVAEERSGDDIRAAAASAQSGISDKRGEHDQRVAAAKADSQRDTDKLIRENAQLQADERSSVAKDVKAKRDEWTGEQDREVEAAGTKADDAAAAADKEVGERRTQAAKDAAAHLDAGNTEIRVARSQAESKAREQKQRAKQETDGGLLGWIGSKITSFFSAIVSAIKDAFALARTLIKAAIEKAQKLAADAIEFARKKIVAAIKLAGDALIAAGDFALAAFPKLRERFHKAIADRVDAAVAAVNKLAEGLTKGVKALLGLLGKALDAALGLLECALLAVVSAYKAVIVGALKAASGLIKALGEFAVIIKDVAANPGQWIANLGRAVRDGIRNCLWSAFKTAVKEWFNQKVEEVLGLGRTIWKVLTSGCITLAQVAKMAWQAILSSLPGIVIQLLLEKLVSLLVPAASAIMLIVEGVRAAWGSISRIIAAFERFLAFLKAVRGGTAAPLFATTLAAAGIALIDFIANWLLQRLKGPAGGVSSALKKMAERIGKVLKKVAAVVMKGVRAVGRGLKRAGSAVMRGVQAVGRGVARAGRAIANSKIGRYFRNSRVGKAVGQAYQTAKRQVTRIKDRLKAYREKRREANSPAGKLRRLERAVAAAKALVNRYSGKRVGRAVLWAKLQFLRRWHRLTALRPVPQGERWAVHGKVNPEILEVTGALVLGSAQDAALLFLRLATEVETEFFGLGALRQHGLSLPHPLAADLDRRRLAAFAPFGAPKPAHALDLTGVSSAADIQSRLRVFQIAGRRTGRQYQQIGDVSVNESLRPSAANPLNVFVEHAGPYGAASSKSPVRLFDKLSDRGVGGRALAEPLGVASSQGRAFSSGILRDLGFRGSDREARAYATALTRKTQLAFRAEPTRFLQRGFLSPREHRPVGLTTGLNLSLVEGGAADIHSVFGQGEFDKALTPASGAVSLISGVGGATLGAPTIEGATRSDLTVAALMERTRQRWSAWKLATERHIEQEARRAGVTNPHLVPSRETMRRILHQYFGEASRV